MHRTAITLLIFASSVWASAILVAAQANVPFSEEAAYRAAYLGDTASLAKWIDEKGGFDPTKWTNNRFGICNILRFAIEGQQPNVIKLFIQKGFPKDSHDVDELFRLRQMDVPTARLFVENIPNFVPNFGVYALSQANRSMNPDVVHYLLEKGVDANGVDRRNPKSIIMLPVLVEAIGLRSRTIVNDLLDHGADPYSPGAIDVILGSRSADLIRFVDRQHRYEKEVDAFQKEYGPPAGSPFPGIWAYRKEGFGSSAFILNADGTGSMSTDAAGFGFVWKGSDHRLDFFPIPPGRQPLGKEPVMSFQLSSDGKSLHTLAQGQEQPEPTWIRMDVPASEIEVTVSPVYLQFEVARLSPDLSKLELQINGRHLEVATIGLLKAGESKYPQKPQPDNIIEWAAFKSGPLGEDTSNGSSNVPYSDRRVSAAYRREPDELGYDHDTKADTIDGQEYTLFPCGSEQSNDGLYYPGYVLLSRLPLPNGRHLMYFYIKPHRVTRSRGERL